MGIMYENDMVRLVMYLHFQNRSHLKAISIDIGGTMIITNAVKLGYNEIRSFKKT